MKALTVFSGTQGPGTANSDFDLPDDAKGAIFVLDITAETGTATLDVKIQFKDELSGKYVDVPGASFAQKSATGVSQLSVFPGLTASANVAVNQALTKTLRAVRVEAGAASDMTYTLSCHPLR